MLGRASSVMFYLVLSCRCSHPVVPVPKRSPMPNISKKQTHQTRKTRILLSTMSPVSMVLISIVADVAASFGRRRWRLCKLQRRSDLKKTCKPNAKPMQSQCKANAKPMQSRSDFWTAASSCFQLILSHHCLSFAQVVADPNSQKPEIKDDRLIKAGNGQRCSWC